MHIQVTDFIKLVIDNHIITLAILGIFLTVIVALTWIQVQQSWRFYLSKQKLLKNIKNTLQNSI